MDFFKEAQKITEAYAVRHHLPVKRQFSDADLADAHKRLDEAEPIAAQIAAEAASEIGQ